MPGARLTRRDRRVIAAGLAAGLGYADIARRLVRPTSTVSREVARNGGRAGYAPDAAHLAAKRRAHHRKPVAVPNQRTEAAHTVEQLLAATLTGAGLPGMAGRVLAALLVTDDAGMSAAELVRHLRVSPASISKSVRYLEAEGLLRRERTAKNRAERYEVGPDAWFQAFLASAQRNHQLADAARRGSARLGRSTPAGARLHALSRFHQQLTDDIIERARHWRSVLADSSGTARLS